MYIGEKKVENIDNNLATLEDGTIVALTDKQLTYMVTEEPVDATTSRDLMLFSIVPDMMEILRIHNVKKVDIQAVLNATV